MHDLEEGEAEATAALVGRGAVEAMRSEDFEALITWVASETPAVLRRFDAAGVNEQGFRAVTNAIATTIWNASPLPSNGYRPRPRPVPGRNEPCSCGSGQKFKRCCGAVSTGFPPVSEEEAWVLLAGFLTSDERKSIASHPGLPPSPLSVIAREMHEKGETDAARAALAPRLDHPEDLDDRFEPALDVLLEIEGDTLDVDDFVDLGFGLAARLSPGLQATVYRHLAPAAIAARDIDLASELLDRIRDAAPNDPTLAPLEVTMLLASGETARASERARFWLAWLRRRSFAQEMPEAVDLLEKTARDPEEAAREFRAAELPALDDLATILAEAAPRPIRPYRLEVVRGDGVFAGLPRGVRGAEDAWQRVWTAPKPDLVSFDLDLPESLIHEPEPWLDVLRANPEAFDSLDVLDSLVLLAGPAAEEIDDGWDGTLLAPLLDRAAAIIRASVAATEGLVRLPWSCLENRPALRVLSRLAYRLDGLGLTDEAAAVYEEVLRLNPNDNHGHRAWLINRALRQGDDVGALALADQFPDDSFAETLFGRGLALWRLGRRGEGEEALRAAAADRPLVVHALVFPDLTEPTLIPGRVTLGGEDEAWLYVEDTRDIWEATPDALDVLRGLPKAALARGRRRRRPSR